MSWEAKLRGEERSGEHSQETCLVRKLVWNPRGKGLASEEQSTLAIFFYAILSLAFPRKCNSILPRILLLIDTFFEKEKFTKQVTAIYMETGLQDWWVLLETENPVSNMETEKWKYWTGSLGCPQKGIIHPGRGGVMMWIDLEHDLVGAYFSVTL